MKKFYITLSLIISFIFCAGQLNAQVYMVVKGETSTPYYDIETAIESAEAGSTVFIPSGAHIIKKSTTIAGNSRSNTILIEKQLNLIGTGSESGLNNSVIQGNMVFTEQASRLFMSGITVESGSVYWDNASNMMMTRCRTEDQIKLSGAGTGNIIEESYLNGGIAQTSRLYGGTGTSSSGYIEVILQKNKISGGITYLKTAQIFHNVIYYPLSTSGGGYYSNFSGCDGCSISNNILISYQKTKDQNSLTLATNSAISYNVCVGYLTQIPENSSHGFNTEGVEYSAIFQNAANNDFHLADNSPAKGKGADGRDPGPFGSSVPPKGKRIPANPSFTDFITGGTVRNDGQLSVSIKAEAQEK